ncbi:MAG: MotA/TolQ/ExbB proton channel family protein [Chitinophagales bacterium]|nr:MotA/TolQ/ExbB proton channel family protein [Chitinophagales bacterium]MDW8274614.1 MotA/TolQ/ExbB proton channel family protein [Chitinophagales bacterium]
MKSRWMNVIIAVGSSVIITIILMILHKIVSGDGVIHRLVVMLGGDLPFGLIQTSTYFIFIFAMLELWNLDRDVDFQKEAYTFNLLPEKEQYILTPADVNQIKLAAIDKQKYGDYLLVNMIKKTCTKYRANKSTTEALEMLTALSKINFANTESEQSYIRYSAWAIPSIGFIGTVIGIANSLGLADKAGTPEGLAEITSALNVAFDTTLVSLFLSIILMLYYHIVQKRVESMLSEMEAYILENLINRIYKE